jgi:hypothetical protein
LIARRQHRGQWQSNGDRHVPCARSRWTPGKRYDSILAPGWVSADSNVSQNITGDFIAGKTP